VNQLVGVVLKNVVLVSLVENVRVVATKLLKSILINPIVLSSNVLFFVVTYCFIGLTQAQLQRSINFLLSDSIFVPSDPFEKDKTLYMVNDSVFAVNYFYKAKLELIFFKEKSNFTQYLDFKKKISEFVHEIEFDLQNDIAWILAKRIYRWNLSNHNYKIFNFKHSGATILTYKDTLLALLKPNFKKVLGYSFSHGKFRKSFEKKIHFTIDDKMAFKGVYPHYSISFLNDSLIAINCLNFQTIFLYNFKQNLVVDVLTNPIFQTINIHKRLSYIPEIYVPKIERLNLAYSSTLYLSVKSFQINNLRFYYQQVKLPNECYKNYLNEEDLDECLQSTPSVITIWNENFELLGSISIPYAFLAINSGYLYAYRREKHNFVVYKYLLLNN
jgi:hypothetical protein